MKKKNLLKTLLGLLLVLLLLLPLASCRGHNASVESPSQDINTLVYIGSQDDRFYYYYDRDTKVMYVVYAPTGYKGGMTPLYNEDGTLKIYKEEEK